MLIENQFRFFVTKDMANNCFGAPRTTLTVFQNEESLKRANDPAYSTCGIWTVASYMNHSCMGNCRRSFIGDVQITRATRDMPEGTELLFSYTLHEGNSSYEEVQEKLKPWGFRCDCAICVDRKKTSPSVLATREKLRAKLVSCMTPAKKTQQVKVESAKAILEEIQATYETPIRTQSSGSGPTTLKQILTPRLAVWDPYLGLATLSMQQGQPNEAVAMVSKSLEALGFKIVVPPTPKSLYEVTADKLFVQSWGMVTDGVVMAFYCLFQAYFGTHTELGRTAKQYLITSYAMISGESETVFDTFPELE